jgi:hypothetical protein
MSSAVASPDVESTPATAADVTDHPLEPKEVVRRLDQIERDGQVNSKNVTGYGKSVLAFGCGFLFTGAVLNASNIWGFDLWHGRHSPGAQFAFIESLIFVAVFGLPSATSYLVGTIIRSVRLRSPDSPSTGRAALLGSGCFAALGLIAVNAPKTNRAVTLAFLTAVPACLGYWLGRRKRQNSD